MNLTYRALPPIWPSGQRTPDWQRQHSKFKTSWPKTLQLLERELRHLGVGYSDAIIVEAGYQPSEIRIDGMPRANAKPRDPAVILNFESHYGPLRYGCDTYHDHQDNIRAVALALEALRAVDRYGVTKRGEQYVGNKALSAPGESTSAREAEALLRPFMVGLTLNLDNGRAVLQQAYRLAAKKLHPDVGGTREQWAELQRAKEALAL